MDKNKRLSGLLFERLMDVCATLRAKGGCPWDALQDHASLKRYLIEECYEVADSIDNSDKRDLAEELGDLLYQIIFHSVVAQDEGSFTIDDVIKGITDKMIRRHPHVFDNLKIASFDELFHNWDRIKKEEKPQKPVPEAFPSLLYAQKVQKRAKKAGVCKDGSVNDSASNIMETTKAAAALSMAADPTEKDMIIGKLLFHAAALARQLDVDAETALRSETLRFKTITEKVD